ncbi:hypothetical protein CYMTET_6307 [Cymbomonas tetramitiformis]|uniref:Uncharacterized protein n=1 Tax=Cymbomonas tetramitiformis TaxID=36881 RepID=A0AAE0GXI0_9CHLO|nr:hypothetical protein CYMTET_6307 [Cymbomonas tetramitiformis]
MSMSAAAQAAQALVLCVVAIAIFSRFSFKTHRSTVPRRVIKHNPNDVPIDSLDKKLRSLQFQDACDCDKNYIRFRFDEEAGLAGNLHLLALALEIGLQAGRPVVNDFEDRWEYYTSPAGCHGAAVGFDCLFSPLSSCSPNKTWDRECTGKTAPNTYEGRSLDADNRLHVLKLINPELLPSPEAQLRFNRMVLFSYGSRWPAWRTYMQGARLPGYTTKGTFWLRSRIVHHLWQPQLALRQLIRRHLKGIRVAARPRLPYIAVHIRASDNLKSIGHDFDVMPDAYFLSRAMNLALNASRTYGIWDVYLASDNHDVIEEAKDPFWAEQGLRISFVEHELRPRAGYWQSQRNATGTLIGRTALNATVEVMATIEMLRHADVLIGSMVSNVFRLGCELNFALNSIEADRMISLDFPWYTDP